MRFAAALLVAVGVLLPPAPDGAAAAETPAVAFATPPDGSTVAGPAVEVAVTTTGFALVPAGGVNQSGQGHVHILIDREPPPPRSFLPTDDPSIVHLGKAPLSTRAVDLSPGKHTLYAVLGDSEHLVVEQQPAKITITVAPGFRAQGALAQACADVARGSGEVRVAVPIVGGAVQGTITSTCAFPTNAGQCVWTDTSFRRVDGTFDPQAGTVTGNTTGFTTRQLSSGDRKGCGQDRTAPLGAQPFQAKLANGTVQGTFGRSTFTLSPDQSVRLASPPTTLAASASGGEKKRSKYWPLPFVGAAALLAGAAWYVVNARQARPSSLD